MRNQQQRRIPAQMPPSPARCSAPSPRACAAVAAGACCGTHCRGPPSPSRCPHSPCTRLGHTRVTQHSTCSFSCGTFPWRCMHNRAMRFWRTGRSTRKTFRNSVCFLGRGNRWCMGRGSHRAGRLTTAVVAGVSYSTGVMNSTQQPEAPPNLVLFMCQAPVCHLVGSIGLCQTQRFALAALGLGLWLCLPSAAASGEAKLCMHRNERWLTWCGGGARGAVHTFFSCGGCMAAIEW